MLPPPLANGGTTSMRSTESLETLRKDVVCKFYSVTHAIGVLAIVFAEGV